MEICTSIDSLQAAQRNWVERAGGSIRAGFIPTIGKLHVGYRSVVEQARRENECVVLSVFASPDRFGSMEEYRRHSYDIEKDQGEALRVGVDIFFAPAVEELYTNSHSTRVMVDPVAEDGRDDFRGRFDGVATEVLKLCQLVRPHTLYWECDDSQQMEVIRQMVEDLYLPIRLVGVPAVCGMDL
ncbi:pantoate--beta-alanine ligase [Pasteuria penetrans]|uniref:pantoate--beta-alanine ligase n=1 Tax=Pasteuria penetrans TaxID=86005 RepID=UPI000F987486|nr:pantoate--beta-alanine ligase [Pasteuria penetrans]